MFRLSRGTYGATLDKNGPYSMELRRPDCRKFAVTVHTAANPALSTVPLGVTVAWPSLPYQSLVADDTSDTRNVTEHPCPVYSDVELARAVSKNGRLGSQSTAVKSTAVKVELSTKAGQAFTVLVSFCTTILLQLSSLVRAQELHENQETKWPMSRMTGHSWHFRRATALGRDSE